MAKKEDYIPGQPAGSQGPQFENFDFAYESEQRQKLAMQSEQANLVDINKQIAATDKELARLAGRVVPAQGRSAKSVAKSANYENRIIDTKRFLEAERAEVVKSLEAKTKSLPKSYSTATEEKNIIKKSIEGPPVITTATEVDPPKYTAIVDPEGAAVMGTRPAPPSEPAKPKQTPIGRITREPSTIKTIVGDDGELISYKSPGSLNYPEIQVGTTASSKPIMNTGPASDYFKERFAMSDQEVLEKYEKLGADYESKLVQEQIDDAKYEFDFNKGEMIKTTGDEFERVSSQEMFVRSSGRPNQVVVPASEANKAAEKDLIKKGLMPDTKKIDKSMTWEDVQREKSQRAKQPTQQKVIGDATDIVPNENARTYGISDEAKRNSDFKISSAAKAAAASKIAQAAKKLGGKTNMLNIPIMTKGSADKIFKDFFGKQDYSS